MVSGFNNVVDAIATGGYNTTDGDTGNIFVLRSDGTVWTAGNGQFGQLGNGTLVSTSTFVQATGLTNIVKLYAAPTHWGAYAMAVNSSGQVFAVGANAVGNLGTGNTTQYSTYQPISGGFTGKVAKIVLASNAMISASYAFSYILDTDGNVWATGYNTGQLGTGDTANLNTFTKIRRGTNGAKAVDIRAIGYGAASA
jgi:alpha-tubulin suppressor-like RCC1 family protein